MSKLNQDKIPVDFSNKYKLVRLDNGRTWHTDTAHFISWDEEGRGKDLHNEPQIGYSCILDGDRFSFTWLTTRIAEILENTPNYIKFKTKNSTYELYIK